MKAVSRLLYILLGIIIFSCILILLYAKNPALANGFFGIAGKLSKNSAVSSGKEEVSQTDIEALLREIEQRGNANSKSADDSVDLGLVSTVVYESLDDYYVDLAGLIKNNYSAGTILTFRMQISDEIFPLWYASNIQDQSINPDSAFSFSVDYEKKEGYYLIIHTVTFK